MATVRVQLRNDTSSNWTSANPVLSIGEMGIETNTAKYKIGDGTTAWNSLAYSSLPSTALTSGGALGTPSSGTLTNTTGLPISTGVSGLGTGVATFLGTPSSANLASAVTDETGSGALVFATAPTLSAPILTNATLVAAEELTSVTGTGFATGTNNVDVLTASVYYYNSNATASGTINVRGNSGTTLNSILPVGASLTVAVIIQNGATAYYPSSFTVDGSAITPKWSGGTAPTAGNATSNDVYTYTITKTASSPTYVVWASQTKFSA
jgi:hypothetical protein